VAVQLEIRDGDPWWMSPDIWVVPGDDPNGAPGQPIAGRDNYLWGRVRNTGATAASGIRVEFFWSNPATGVLRSNSTLVGYGYADVPAGGGSTEVLCITPWVPVVVNDGHECVVAQALHPGDPLPAPISDAFSAPTYRQVAQRNLTVVVLAAALVQTLVLQLALPARARGGRTRVALKRGGQKLSRERLEQLGLPGGLRPADVIETAGFGESAACTDERGEPELQLELRPGTSAPAYVRVGGARPAARSGFSVGSAPRGIRPHTRSLVPCARCIRLSSVGVATS
jgi:hypothetical protein